MHRHSRFEDAEKRVRPDGKTETLCEICQTWDVRGKSAFYQRHGQGKCDVQAAAPPTGALGGGLASTGVSELGTALDSDAPMEDIEAEDGE
jgi:hypothetical protein